MKARLLLLPLLSLLPLGAAAPARAFCGFYVSPAEGSLYNDASMVVLMREGNRTVLSMRNAYQGPPEDFAMVVPVPVVLQQANVQTLRPEVFEHIDRLAAPRLVEYWEQDPCRQRDRRMPRGGVGSRMPTVRSSPAEVRGSLGVRVEAQFAVGEYDIVVLSARDSQGLETWLLQEHYRIPQGAAALLRPYVEAGTKFFVARVNIARVTMQNGRAQLSPLRVHYDAPTFSLPVRLGLINSAGTQDLIVHILARRQRFEVANYPNVAIPTNLVVRDSVRASYGPFYARLFDKTLERNPGAVVTEYAWTAGSCDPCPTGALGPSDILTLGGDVIEGGAGLPEAGGAVSAPILRRMMQRSDWVLTRLHARYASAAMAQDLVFRAAPPLEGGRGMPDQSGRLDRQAPSQAASSNNFQGRYAILHHWRRPIRCANPQRGVWGGPPDGSASRPVPALDLATQPRGTLTLRSLIPRGVPELGIPGRGSGSRSRQRPNEKPLLRALLGLFLPQHARF